MKFTQDESEKKYKNSFKAGGYKPPKKVVKPTKPTANQMFDVGCNCNKKCKCKQLSYSFIILMCFLDFI